MLERSKLRLAHFQERAERLAAGGNLRAQALCAALTALETDGARWDYLDDFTAQARELVLHAQPILEKWERQLRRENSSKNLHLHNISLRAAGPERFGSAVL